MLLQDEIAFLARYGVPQEALVYAAMLARRQGVSADAALLGEGVVSEEAFYRALAAHLRVPYLHEPPDVAPGAAATIENGYVRLIGGTSGLRWLFAPRGPQIVRLMSAVRRADYGGAQILDKGLFTTFGFLSDYFNRSKVEL